MWNSYEQKVNKNVSKNTFLLSTVSLIKNNILYSVEKRIYTIQKYHIFILKMKLNIFLLQDKRYRSFSIRRNSIRKYDCLSQFRISVKSYNALNKQLIYIYRLCTFFGWIFWKMLWNICETIFFLFFTRRWFCSFVKNV